MPNNLGNMEQAQEHSDKLQGGSSDVNERTTREKLSGGSQNPHILLRKSQQPADTRPAWLRRSNPKDFTGEAK